MPEARKCFVFRSKKSGRYFVFQEYCSDGYGMYEDNLSWITVETMPTIFGTDRLPAIEFKCHTHEEIEAVPVTILIGV